MKHDGSVDRWIILRHGLPSLAVFLLLPYAGWMYALAALAIWYGPMFAWVAWERHRRATNTHQPTSSAEGGPAL